LCLAAGRTEAKQGEDDDCRGGRFSKGRGGYQSIEKHLAIGIVDPDPMVAAIVVTDNAICPVWQVFAEVLADGRQGEASLEGRTSHPEGTPLIVDELPFSVILAE
jgi:hypothetical protein